MDRKKRITFLLVTLAVTLACVPALPAVASLPTQPVGAVDTMVAGTSAAAAKFTALASSPTPRPNDTLVPSHTPQATPTVTATLNFRYVSPTPFPSVTFDPNLGGGGGGGGGGGSGGGGGFGPPPEFACRIVSVIPPRGGHVQPDKDFKTTWRVANRGTATWDSNDVDYRYFVGAKLHTQELYDIPFSVPPDWRIDLVVLMHSPIRPGTYSTSWILHASHNYFCKMEMIIIVP